MKSKNSNQKFFLSLKESFLKEQIDDDNDDKKKEKTTPLTQPIISPAPEFKELEKNPLKKAADIVPEVPDQEFVSALIEDFELCNELDPFWDEI